jgi:pseudouridine synthase
MARTGRSGTDDRGAVPPPAAAERLQKVIARAGLCSRRAAEALIRDGRVRVNGCVVRTLGSRVRIGRDRVAVDGAEVRRAPLAYLLLHKPRGVVSTLKDPQGRPTVLNLLPEELPRVYPVGRLDLNSTGLLLLTNDGELAQRLMHPRHAVPKTYRVKVAGLPDDRALERLRRGVVVEGGRAAARTVRVLGALPTKTWLEITVLEGRKHLVRRLCDAIGHPAEKLCRLRIGPLGLEGLPPGGFRALSRGEVGRLRAAVGLAAWQGPAAPRQEASSRRRTPPFRVRSRRRPVSRSRA